MLSLNTEIPTEYIKQNKKFQKIKKIGIFCCFFNCDCEDYGCISIVDIIDSNLLLNDNKRKVLDQCIVNLDIKSISAFIIECIKD